MSVLSLRIILYSAADTSICNTAILHALCWKLQEQITTCRLSLLAHAIKTSMFDELFVLISVEVESVGIFLINALGGHEKKTVIAFFHSVLTIERYCFCLLFCFF